MKTQLRIYTINRGQLQQFAQERKELVLPLRIEHGFKTIKFGEPLSIAHWG